MPMSSKQKPTMSQSQDAQPKRKRSCPEKPVKIDDSHRNVARALFGMRSGKFNRAETKKPLPYRQEPNSLRDSPHLFA